MDIIETPKWISSIVRLSGLTALFYTVYSASPHFKSFIDSFIGANIQHQIGVILFSFFPIELLFSKIENNRSVKQPSRELKEQLVVFQNENLSLKAQVSDLQKQLPTEITEKDFQTALIAYIAHLSTLGRHRNIIRIHTALSRYLWVEGLLQARLKLGEATDAAASELGETVSNLSALIDDMGWTLVALKDYSRAKSKIEYGLHLAEEKAQPYWVAKAHRHLAGIQTILRQFPEATKELDLATRSAEEIRISKEKTEMIAGIEYARAIIDLMRGEYDLAMKHLTESDRLRIESGDSTRAVRSFALRGKIYFAKHDTVSVGKAKAQFRNGLSRATDLGRRDEIIRNLNGLAKVAEYESDEQLAEKYKSQASELLKDTPVPYEIEDHQ